MEIMIIDHANSPPQTDLLAGHEKVECTSIWALQKERMADQQKKYGTDNTWQTSYVKSECHLDHSITITTKLRFLKTVAYPVLLYQKHKHQGRRLQKNEDIQGFEDLKNESIQEDTAHTMDRQKRTSISILKELNLSLIHIQMCIRDSL